MIFVQVRVGCVHLKYHSPDEGQFIDLKLSWQEEWEENFPLDSFGGKQTGVELN